MGGYCLVSRAALGLKETGAIQIENMSCIDRQSYGEGRRKIEMVPLKAVKS